MKHLRFEYSTTLNFSEAVTGHCFSLRCIPVSDGRQELNEPIVNASGVLNNTACVIIPEDAVIWHSRDSFGNLMLCGRLDAPHDVFSFRISGTAGFVSSYCIEGSAHSIYSFPSPLTKAGDAISAFYAGLAPSGNDILHRALYICDKLFGSFSYEKHVTDVSTDAETAFSGGRGVCQDYAQIFLSLCRLNGIPCRYVSGLACDDGETHAWTEINDGKCWYGIDPANNCLINSRYLKLCHGRDYSDCPIERGIYTGGISCKQTIYSRTEEI